ncbi:uncharacterized protein LOC117088617 [Trachypithecus francoisi]|uniref:uncharacterized protein LOC117088617 n=1 Tax=Trachypithecus francoisi TaxID=54180 RepID=UPI00141A992D|nr:uncharacterized protein LOC117088617 [Trachypithecus francoisi]
MKMRMKLPKISVGSELYLGEVCQDDGFRVGGLKVASGRKPRLRGKTLPARGTRRFGAAAVSRGAATGLCAGVTPPAVSFILLSRPTIYLNGYKVHVISLRSFLLMSCSSAWLVKTIRVIQGWKRDQKH